MNVKYNINVENKQEPDTRITKDLKLIIYNDLVCLRDKNNYDLFVLDLKYNKFKVYHDNDYKGSEIEFKSKDFNNEFETFQLVSKNDDNNVVKECDCNELSLDQDNAYEDDDECDCNHNNNETKEVKYDDGGEVRISKNKDNNSINISFSISEKDNY